MEPFTREVAMGSRFRGNDGKKGAGLGVFFDT